jgi:hypothetical protein
MHCAHACRIHEYQDGRSRKLEEVRNRREWAELQECTFAPKTNTRKPQSRASSQTPVLVRGLAAHMSKLERAKKMAAEEAARRAKVFLEEPKAPRAKFTIAKPFNISDNNPVRLSFAVSLCLRAPHSSSTGSLQLKN